MYKWGCYVIYLDEGGFFMKTLTQIVGMEKKYKEGILVKDSMTHGTLFPFSSRLHSPRIGVRKLLERCGP